MLFVHASVKPHCSVAERLAGYRAAIAEAGLESHECLQKPEEEAIDVLTRSGSRPTAVVCYSNLEATLIVHAMWQYGVSIPAELSVVGFNDEFSVQYMTPPLTTIGFDAAKIGELGAQLVLQEVQSDASDDTAHNGRTPSVLTIKPKLNVRGSTGPCLQREVQPMT
jgi:LacI family transcriptional regulator